MELPTDVWKLIILLLNQYDDINIELTCKDWQKIVKTKYYLVIDKFFWTKRKQMMCGLKKVKNLKIVADGYISWLDKYIHLMGNLRQIELVEFDSKSDRIYFLLKKIQVLNEKSQGQGQNQNDWTIKFNKCFVCCGVIELALNITKNVVITECWGTNNEMMDIFARLNMSYGGGCKWKGIKRVHCRENDKLELEGEFGVGGFNEEKEWDNVVGLNLKWCDDFSFVSRIGHLRKFELCKSKACDDAFNALSCLNLDELVLSECCNLVGLRFIGNKKLRILRIYRCNKVEFGGLENVVVTEELILSNCSGLRDVSFIGVGGFGELRVLDVNGWGKLSGVDEVGKLKKLEELVVKHRNLECWWKVFEGLSNLRKLDLSNTIVNACGRSAMDWHELLRCINVDLIELSVHGCDWINNLVVNLMGKIYLNLRVLNVGWCDNITSVGCVNNFMMLENLNMDLIKFVEYDFHKLTALRNLREMKLHYHYHRCVREIMNEVLLC